MTRSSQFSWKANLPEQSKFSTRTAFNFPHATPSSAPPRPRQRTPLFDAIARADAYCRHRNYARRCYLPWSSLASFGIIPAPFDHCFGGKAVTRSSRLSRCLPLSVCCDPTGRSAALADAPSSARSNCGTDTRGYSSVTNSQIGSLDKLSSASILPALRVSERTGT